MEVAGYDICVKAMEHHALADILDRNTAYVWIEDGDVDLYDERDVFVDWCGDELKDKRYYVPFDIAKANNPPFHELIPAPTIDEILEAFKSLQHFGVKGEVTLGLDTDSYKCRAAFFRLRHSRDWHGGNPKIVNHHIVNFEADDSVTDKLMELLMKVANEYLDPMTGELK